MKIEEVIEKVVKSPIMVDQNRRYKNSIALSGFLLRKPKFFKHDETNVESCSLILYQLNNTAGTLKIDSYSCMVYDKELVAQLKENKNVLLVAAVGNLRYSKKVHGLYAQVWEMQTLVELDIELAEEWERKEDDNEKVG